MSERIDYNNIRNNDPLYKNFEDTHTAGTDGIEVDIYRLLELTEGHPVERCSFESFVSQLDYPCWSLKSTELSPEKERVAPSEVIDLIVTHGYKEAAETKPELARHIEKIHDADVSYPVHVYHDVVIDGMHRLSKIVVEHKIGNYPQDFVTIKRLKEIPNGSLINED